MNNFIGMFSTVVAAAAHLNALGHLVFFRRARGSPAKPRFAAMAWALACCLVMLLAGIFHTVMFGGLVPAPDAVFAVLFSTAVTVHKGNVAKLFCVRRSICDTRKWLQ